MRVYLLLIICGFIGMPVGSSQHEIIQHRLNEIFDDNFQDDEPGGCILIKKGEEEIFLASYGLEDLATKKRITPHTIFNTGSISKTFVSNGILILHQRGKLSIDDSIYKYFPDFENKDLAQQVTIKHLLSHTSGLPDLRNAWQNQEFYMTAKDQENWAPIKAAQELKFNPGSAFDYSNPAYNGLALIIEKVTNKPWQEFIAKNIFDPAHMTHSVITNGPHPESGVAHAYAKNDKGQFEEYDYGEFPTFAAAGNGGIWSTVIDLVKYEKAIQSNLLIDNALTTMSRTVFKPSHWASETDAFVGYGWFLGERFLFENSNLGVDIVYHTGSQGGFRGYHVVIPEKDIVFVALFNRPVDRFVSRIQRALSLLKEHKWLDK